MVSKARFGEEGTRADHTQPDAPKGTSLGLPQLHGGAGKDEDKGRVDPSTEPHWEAMHPAVQRVLRCLEVLGEKGTLPWPAPSSFSAHEMQLGFSKLSREEA